MKKIELKMNSWKLCIAFLVIIILLVGVASASINKNKETDDNQCPDGSTVKEETAGLTKDGKDFLIKRVTEHHKSNVRPDAKISRASGCYKLMGVKWASSNLPVSYGINPTNPQFLNETDIIQAISTSAETWDASTNTELFNNAYKVDYNARWDGGDPQPDYQNSIIFGNNNANPDVIAVTTTWYTYFGRQIVDFDVSLETDYTWGNVDISGNSVMDMQNIATHEIGHGIGLADLYNSCTEETMYGYSSYGETKKRDLNAGDIAGLQKLYGV